MDGCFVRSGMLGAGWSWLRRKQPWMVQMHQLDAGGFRPALAQRSLSQGKAVPASGISNWPLLNLPEVYRKGAKPIRAWGILGAGRAPARMRRTVR